MSTAHIIVTRRYIKSGNKKTKTKRANYTKYIATRESVEKRPQTNTPVTKNQTQFINELLAEFPKAKLLLEYEDYTVNPTVENASELISTIIERYADVLGNRRNFVGYMAMRPGTEKRGSITPGMYGLTLYFFAVRTLCDWATPTRICGVSLSSGILLI